ncbi:3-deoxy-manno-octulosonate cytidylyltransferase [Salinimonas lutimaris]|uniref:3-deoxy-manno-octulosonate cytidylyltransferase n=1 Tax=Salinimonas lutimaris TaxID=914153 RepID=UPI0010BFC292|nr:3-deoxy-manno-octulosonate cytidylyltransferase [Salinimonas lutimaris]
MSFVVIIPARFGSSRFPGKPLADIKGKPMIAHVIDRAFEAGASQVVVATDDERIGEAVGERCTVCMTRSDHNSGTERLAEVVKTLQLPEDTIVVNVQGDEPFVPAENIQQVAANLADRPDIPMATLATPFDNADDVSNPNMVKVIANQHQEAIYFSRSAIPFDRAAMLERTESLEPGGYLRHIGIYAYRASYITRYVEYPSTVLEQLESLEQLRALWYGDKIHVDVAVAAPPVGIDTPEDLVHLLSIL